jgi:taurine transport system ATP-binding protein
MRSWLASNGCLNAQKESPLSTLHVKDVSVQYDTGKGQTTMALSTVNLEMNSGDFVVAIGASGCGKTTLLSCIAGFLEPSAGAILLNGSEIHGPGADRGVVFQKHALMPWLNVIENVEFGLRMRGVPKAQRRAVAEDKIQAVGLSKYAQSPVYQLSGGMQQRVGIARALASNPEVLLMDEPLGALDALTRESIQETILRLWDKEQKIVFFITHSVEEALFLATDLIVMSPSPGRIVQQFKLSFCKDFIQSGDARAVKSQPEFIRMREEVVSLIHDTKH